MRLLHVSVAAVCAIAVSSAPAGANGKAEYDRRVAADLVQLFQWLDRDHDRAVTRIEAEGDVNFMPRFADMDIDRNDSVSSHELARYIEQTHGLRIDEATTAAAAGESSKPATPPIR